MTRKELTQILKDHYTSEELIDALELEPHDIVDAFEESIEILFDELVQRVRDELGYGEEGKL